MGKLWDPLKAEVLYGNLPASYAQTIEVIQSKEAITHEEIHCLLCQQEDLILEEKVSPDITDTKGGVNNVKQGGHKNFNGKKFNKPKSSSSGKHNGSGKEQSDDSSSGQHKPKQGNPNIVCFRCGGKGHLQQDCGSPPKAKEPKGAKPQSEESGTVYCVTTYEQKVNTVMYTQSATNRYDLNEWYLDSSATCHCTGCKDWLHGYKDLKSSGRYLEFTNGSREDVKGMGTLIIQT